MSREEARQAVAELVERYLADRANYEKADGGYSEAQARIDFISPFLEAFGWDLTNRDGLPTFAREVQVEESVELPDENNPAAATAAGNPDYTIQPNGKRHFFVEAKKPGVRIETAPAPAYQTRRYGWSAGLSVSVLTNFVELAIYDCRVQPQPGDGPAVARIPGRLYRCEDYVEQFDDLWRSLSKEAVLDGTFDAEFDIERELRGEASFDSVFLEQIRRWRRELATDIAQRNAGLDARAVGRAAQRLLNRLVFLRVCEDRNLEDYGDLLKINDRNALEARFREADQLYNAGLFRALDEVEIDADLVHGLVAQLYYPESPYAFSVVEAPVLASIYEQFLAERVELRADRSVHLVRKPEIVHAGGIVPTPSYIVDAILDRTLAPIVEKLPLDDIRQLRIADLSCGSGTFLLGAFRMLLRRFEVAGEEASLELKHALLRNNIFGVDIDPEAVEVTRFNLSLAVIEGEDRDRVERFGAAALPDIDAQVVSGNSLITPHIFEVFPEVRDNREDLLSINPFDFDATFASVMAEGGFDVIVGNPPYVRIQTLAEFDPVQVAYFQAHSPFKSARSFNFDKYLLFIERALGLLNDEGRFGFIVPHRFMSTLPGQAVREILSDGKHVREIVHFGQEQVFEGATTYTCLLIGSKEPGPAFTVAFVKDLRAWRDSGTSQVRKIAAEDVGAAPWSFSPNETRAIFERLQAAHAVKLSDVADIFVGVQTSADDILLPKPKAVSTDEITVELDGKEWRIEKAVCRPAVRDRTLRPYDGRPDPDAWAIFPYEIKQTDKGKQAVVIPPERMEAEFPLAWDYLTASRERLEGRSIEPRGTPDTWYRYGRSQSLTKLEDEKIIIRVMSLVPQYNWDPDGLLAPGGGDGGPYGFIRPLADSPVSLPFLIALLSHPVIDAMVWEESPKYRGGYFPHRKAFLKGLPVPTHDAPHAERIAEMTMTLIETTMRVRTEPDAQVRLVIERDRAAQRLRIEGEVSSLLGLSASDLKAVVGE